MVDKILPSDIEDPGRIFPTKPVDTEEHGQGTTQPFASFMKGGPVASAPSSMISPFALMQGNTPLTTAPNTDTLLGQVQGMQGTSKDIQNQLGTPQLKLKASTKYLLKNKLSESTDHLRSLNASLGTNAPAGPTLPPVAGPLGKFLNYITDGQAQMEAAKQQLQNLKAKGTSLSPGDFLLVQLKMNKAQQLLEFSSVLLSTAVSDIKQMMQVQI
jgi:hypothetical protein